VTPPFPIPPSEWIELRAAELPGPGQYGVGVSKGPLLLSGGKFNVSKSKTNLDWIIYNAMQMPGPGQYDASKSQDAMFKSPSCRLLGRTGPRSMPFPYGGPKPAPTRAHTSHARSSLDSSSYVRSPDGARPNISPNRKAVEFEFDDKYNPNQSSLNRTAASSRKSSSHSRTRSSRPSSHVGSHPLAEDPSCPRHRKLRLEVSTLCTCARASCSCRPRYLSVSPRPTIASFLTVASRAAAPAVMEEGDLIKYLHGRKHDVSKVVSAARSTRRS
jgi:hypothetical protein